MSALSDKYYSKEELLQIAVENDIPEVFHSEFIAFVEKDIREMTDEKIETEAGIKKHATTLAVSYFGRYLGELRKGHGERWARIYADQSEHPKQADASAFIYATVYENAVNLGNSDDIASFYALKISEYYGDQYSRARDIQHDSSDLYNETRIVGYLKGWEFAKMNQVKDYSAFIAKFEKLYSRTYSSPPFKTQILTDESDLAMINKVLKEINNKE